MGSSAFPLPSMSYCEGECLPNREVTQVRNTMMRFTGHLCDLEQHHPLSAFQASSHSDEGTALGVSSAPTHQSQVRRACWCPLVSCWTLSHPRGAPEVCAHGPSPRLYEKAGMRHGRHTQYAFSRVACCAVPSGCTYKAHIQR